MKLVRLLAAFLAAPLLAGASCERRPDMPGPTLPEHTVTVEVRNVPINKALTARCPIEPAGKPSDAPYVAAKRKEALEKCNGQLEAIEQIQGTPTNE